VKRRAAAASERIVRIYVRRFGLGHLRDRGGVLVLTKSHPLSGSKAPPPQFAPPMIPGSISVLERTGA